MPGSACLALAYGDDAGLRIEVTDLEARKFAVAASGHKRALNEIPERALTRVDQASLLIGGQKAHHGGVGFAERLDPSPRVVAPDMALVEGVIERSFEDG